MSRLETFGLAIKMDWRSYYKKFCAVHGSPVVHGGRQLFEDGWQYGLTSYQGPEYPPPEDPKDLLLLQQVYWQLRYNTVSERVQWLQQHINMWQEWAEHRSLPLQQITTYQSRNDSGSIVLSNSEPGDLDLQGLELRLQELLTEQTHCKQRLDYAKANTKEGTISKGY